MFLGLKNQYCESDSTSHSNVHIQHNPYQITNDILNQNKKFYNLYGSTKDPEQQRWFRERKTQLKESDSLTSDYTTKLKSPKHYGTGTKTEI